VRDVEGEGEGEDSSLHIIGALSCPGGARRIRKLISQRALVWFSLSLSLSLSEREFSEESLRKKRDYELRHRWGVLPMGISLHVREGSEARPRLLEREKEKEREGEKRKELAENARICY